LELSLSHWQSTPDSLRGENERRAHPRLSCKGVAKVLVLPDGPQLAGNLVNLSLGGCCIEFEREILAPMYAQLDVLLDACDLRVRLSAEIRRRDDNQVGIRFLEMSARKEEQIRYLIQELVEIVKARGVGGDGKENAGD